MWRVHAEGATPPPKQWENFSVKLGYDTNLNDHSATEAIVNTQQRQLTDQEVVVIAVRGGAPIGYELDHLDRLVPVFPRVPVAPATRKSQAAPRTGGRPRRQYLS